MENQLQRISELKQQLLASGYHPIQLNNIIREVVNNGNLASITPEQGNELIDVLEYYCHFSKKCWEK